MDKPIELGIGFDTRDAGVSHAPKLLEPSMTKKDISQIIMGIPEIVNSRDGELAILRYEYDIRKIRERNWWGKNKSRLHSAKKSI